MAQELGRPQGTLTVLSHGADPFGCGTPAHVAHAEWFAALWNEHMGHGGHLRRLHYRLVSQASPVAMVGGAPYKNTVNCWSTLKLAGKWARYLGLIDADVLEDRRSPRPQIHLWDEAADCSIEVSEPEMWHAYLAAPSMPDLPTIAVTRPRVPQRYHVEIWVEKSDVEDIVLPIARSYGLNYCPFLGQPGLKPCRQLVERAWRSGSPVRILYISDFDPQGESMPVAVARKIEFILAERGLDLDIQVIPLALTKQQCIDLKLPRIPIKDGDRGKGRFEERHGEGATELDALEALHPGMLRSLILTEAERYYDPTLQDRIDKAYQRLSDEVAAVENAVVLRYEDQVKAHRAALEPIQKQLDELRKQVAEWRKGIEPTYQAIAEDLKAEAPDLDAIEWPEPADGAEHPNPLFDSRRSYLEQIEVYKRHQHKPTEKRERRDKGTQRKPNGHAAS
jgi:hypothetical protein